MILTGRIGGLTGTPSLSIHFKTEFPVKTIAFTIIVHFTIFVKIVFIVATTGFLGGPAPNCNDFHRKDLYYQTKMSDRNSIKIVLSLAFSLKLENFSVCFW